MSMEPAEAWNKALRENMFSPDERLRLVQIHEKLVHIRESLGLPEPHEFQYYPEYNPLMPASEVEFLRNQKPSEDWNQALQENMLRPYSPPEPAYEDMLFAPADWQKQEATQ